MPSISIFSFFEGLRGAVSFLTSARGVADFVTFAFVTAGLVAFFFAGVLTTFLTGGFVAFTTFFTVFFGAAFFFVSFFFLVAILTSLVGFLSDRLKQKFLHPLRDEGTPPWYHPDYVPRANVTLVAVTGFPGDDYCRGFRIHHPGLSCEKTGEFGLIIPLWG
jgi:hypothetical protein